MKNTSIFRLAFCLILTVFVLLSLTSCGEAAKADLFPAAFEEAEYRNNPGAATAVKQDENTIRVSFSQPVRGGEALTAQVFYCEENKDPIPAEAFRAYGFAKDESGLAYASVYEFDFSAVVSSGQILFQEAESDGDLAMGSLLYTFGGAGLYAESSGENGEVRTLLPLTDGEIELPEEEVRMIDARFTDRGKGIMQMTFTLPVRCLTDWRGCVFVSDISNPNPGVAGSWQYGIFSADPIDAVTGEDGKIYAKSWQITVGGDAASLPAQGVVRISENDSGAPAEYASANDNGDCGRVAVAIDGRPLLADFIRGWDVSFAPYRVE